jgi:EmrB/QacA subfamily drug resistance transporter
VTPGAADLDPRRWPALAVCVSAVFLTLLDVSIVNVALPSIGRGTGAGAAELQWVVSGYALAFGMVPIIAGRLGDDRGRKRMLLVGIAAFVAFSALAGLAPTPGVLIAARVLQGLAGGLLNPQVSGLIQQLFPPVERGKAFGALGAAVGIATAAGPVVGGGIIALGGEEFGWRLCFLVNVPIGIASWLLCRRLLPEAPRREHTRPLDLPGVALLAVGVFGLLFPAVQFDADHDPRLAFLVVPALAVLAGFHGWERGPGRRRGYPLIDLALFRIRSYTDGVVLAVLFFCAYTGTPLVLALFLQDGLGFSPLQSGLTASAYAVGAAVSAPVGGRLVARAGQRVLVAALTLFGVGWRRPRRWPRPSPAASRRPTSPGSWRRRCWSRGSAAARSSPPTRRCRWPRSTSGAARRPAGCCRPRSASATPWAPPSSARCSSPSPPAPRRAARRGPPTSGTPTRGRCW